MAELIPHAMVTNNYSMTEAGTAFTYLPPGELTRRPGSVGMPLPPTEIRIADDAGEPLPAGEVGEVLIGVGEDHREYYGDPEATARTWSGPWLRSGDLGRARRGRLPLHRRPGQGRGDPGRQQHQRRRGRERALRARRRARSRRRRHPPRGAGRGRRRVRASLAGAPTSTPTSSARSAPNGSPTTRCRGRSGSSTSCPATPTARSLKRNLVPPVEVVDGRSRRRVEVGDR